MAAEFFSIRRKVPYWSATPILELLSPHRSSSAVAKPPTPTMMASAISEAIKPYSMAVAPELSDKNLRSTVGPFRVNGYALTLMAKR